MRPPRPKLDVPGVIGYECKHAIYSTAIDGSPHDLLTIKEILHYEDGRQEPRLSFYGDFEKTFMVTKPDYRNHTDKKEWELQKRCDKFKSTQVELPRRIAQALGRPIGTKIRQLASSQYLYGSDISTPTLLKAGYMQKWPNARSKNRVAVLDLETDVNTEEEYPITGQLTFKDKAILAVDKNWYGPSADPVKEIQASLHKHEPLASFIKSRNINVEVVMCDGPVEIIKQIFDRAHKWMPDIIAIWNQNFDIPKILNTLKDFGYDPKDILCDPRVPRNYRRCEYEQGIERKKAASGRETTVDPAMQWHTLHLTASFYVLCAMCTYRRVRIAGGNAFSYGLDAVLDKEVDLGKLRVSGLAHLDGVLESSLKWHDVMQTYYRDIYCSYALWDCVGTEILDETTNDLSTMISTLCGWSEYSEYHRQPVMLCNDLHFFVQQKGLVIGTASSSVATELDDETMDLTGWIVALPSYMIDDRGIPLFKNAPELKSTAYGHVWDLDVSSSYPNGIVAMSISKETTEIELCAVEGVSEEVMRRAGINMMSATVNAVEIATDMYGLPQMDEMLASFLEDEETYI